jgi:hypothetical protein
MRQSSLKAHRMAINDYYILFVSRTSSFRKHDGKISKMLGKYRGKEPKLCLILAKKYDTVNPLNRVFVSRVTEDHFEDFVKLTTLYLRSFTCKMSTRPRLCAPSTPTKANYSASCHRTSMP